VKRQQEIELVVDTLNEFWDRKIPWTNYISYEDILRWLERREDESVSIMSDEQARLQTRVKELELIELQHKTMNGELRKELDHWKREAEIWKYLYSK